VPAIDATVTTTVVKGGLRTFESHLIKVELDQDSVLHEYDPALAEAERSTAAKLSPCSVTDALPLRGAFNCTKVTEGESMLNTEVPVPSDEATVRITSWLA
jgi:hypothetical protein